MSEYFEIAYAVSAKRLCLLTGTGFSKELSGGVAPGWKELLVNVCDNHIKNDGFKDALFGEDSPKLQLEEIAQILKVELKKQGESLHKLVAKQISEIALDCDIPKTQEFFTSHGFRILTTNYDKLAEELVGEDATSVCPGKAVPRSDGRVKILHVHGSVDSPEHMVITSDDYFRFMEKDTYFSRKMSTLIHENTVVIFGYSLGDTNLKAILNDHVGFVRKHKVSNSIFFVSRREVPQQVIDYYYSCFGIRVVPHTSVEEFFQRLLVQIPKAQERFERSLRNYNAVFLQDGTFKDERLKKENSLYEIVASMGAMGSSLDAPEVVETFKHIVARKRAFCGEDQAWIQYKHLANWLIYLGSLLDIRATSLEKTYLEAVEFSMDYAGNSLGRSWDAYKAWDNGWSKICADNRALICTYMGEKGTHSESESIIKRG